MGSEHMMEYPLLQVNESTGYGTTLSGAPYNPSGTVFSNNELGGASHKPAVTRHTVEFNEADTKNMDRIPEGSIIGVTHKDVVNDGDASLTVGRWETYDEPFAVLASDTYPKKSLAIAIADRDVFDVIVDGIETELYPGQEVFVVPHPTTPWKVIATPAGNPEINRRLGIVLLYCDKGEERTTIRVSIRHSFM